MNNHQWAVAAVREACRLTLKVQQSAEAITKEDSSPVTVADFLAQAVIARAVPPEAVLVAEEEAQTLADSPPALSRVTSLLQTIDPAANSEQACEWVARGGGRPGDDFWTLDPVDGTKGFLRGDQYAVALARVQNGVPTFAVLGCPSLKLAGLARGVLFVAGRGGGARAMGLDGEGSGKPIKVSACREPARARVLRSYEAAHTDGDEVAAIRKSLGVAVAALGIDSQAKYGVLAGGEGELYLRIPHKSRPDYRENIWDHAAGSLVVEEAGGRVTDLDGRPLDFSQGRKLLNNRGVLASNGLLHEPTLEAIANLGDR